VLPPHAVPVKATLVRWDPAKPLRVENVVVMEAADAERHERVDGGPGMWGEEVKAVVERHAKELERNREWVM
jgi:hypothetical protein